MNPALDQRAAPRPSGLPANLRPCGKTTGNYRIQTDQTIEEATGEDIEVLRATPLDELRKKQEAKQGHSLKFRSSFPTIGRGNVLRRGITSHDDVEARMDAILGSAKPARKKFWWIRHK
jgi:hypothetical protein